MPYSPNTKRKYYCAIENKAFIQMFILFKVALLNTCFKQKPFLGFFPSWRASFSETNYALDNI